jgi:hypothetical protein
VKNSKDREKHLTYHERVMNVSSNTWLRVVLVQIVAALLVSLDSSRADLVVKAGEPKDYTQKTLIKLDLHNTFTNKIESARGVMFLLDEKGKVVGQESRWIIGGTKDRPPLAADGNSTFYFVVPTSKPFSKTKLTVTKLILEGGQQINAAQHVKVESAVK